MEENLKEEFLSSEEVFKGRILHLFCDCVKLPDGSEASRECVRHPGGVCVLPLDGDENVTCVRQFRYPHGQILTELPAGKLDSKSEDPRAAALRELEEETGYLCGKLTFLGEFFSSPAILDEVIYLYLAEDLTPGKTHTDCDEFLSDVKIPLKTLVDDVLDGKIPDGKTQALVLRTYEMLKRRKGGEEK